MTRRSFRLATLALVVVATAMQLLVTHDGFYALSQDDSYRTLDAHAWSIDPSAGSTTWLPAHRVLVGSALRAWPDLIVTPRVVSGVLGVLCVLLVMWLAWELFGERSTSAFAGVLAVVYPARLVLGAVPLAEILFITMVLLSMALLARWLARVESAPRLLLAAAAFGVTTTVRYEGWLFAGGFALLVVARVARTVRAARSGPRSPEAQRPAQRPAQRSEQRSAQRSAELPAQRSAHRPAQLPAQRPEQLAAHRLAARLVSLATVVALTCGFPLYWLVTHAGASGGALTEASRLYAVFNPTDPLTLLRHNPLWQLVTSNARSLTLVGLIPLVGALRSEGRVREWAFVPAAALVALSVAAFVAHALPSHTFWRIPAAWGVLIVPFAARWIVTTPIAGPLRAGGSAAGATTADPERTASSSVARRRRAGVARTALLVLLATPSVLACVDMTRRSAMVPGVVELGRTLDARLDGCGGACKVLLDNATVDYVHVVVASQHPSAFLFTEADAALPPASIVHVEEDPRAIDTYEGGDIRFLVLRTESTIERVRRSSVAREIGRFGPWRLFESP